MRCFKRVRHKSANRVKKKKKEQQEQKMSRVNRWGSVKCWNYKYKSNKSIIK